MKLHQQMLLFTCGFLPPRQLTFAHQSKQIWKRLCGKKGFISLSNVCTSQICPYVADKSVGSNRLSMVLFEFIVFFFWEKDGSQFWCWCCGGCSVKPSDGFLGWNEKRWNASMCTWQRYDTSSKQNKTKQRNTKMQKQKSKQVLSLYAAVINSINII